ncbi:MAG TPA: toprim domain-containing protein [Clostridiales bacterium]|nr:toprim domain-containing protein [Clostridiales bacterium]
MSTKVRYNDDSITQLKGADRVRKRPGVLFGSDGVEGCAHSIFEIISNSIDEARDGFGDTIIVTYFEDYSVEVQDFGRGIPLDYNEKEGKYNWELLFCELYAGGKYKTIDDGSYEYSLGLNGLGLCATQYASDYMEAEIHRGGFKYNLSFKKGSIVGDMQKEPYSKKDTGTRIKWLPDLEVFSDIAVPLEYFQDTLKRQAIVNGGIKFILKYQKDGKFETYEYLYENGITDYLRETARDKSISDLLVWHAEREGRDRKDQKDYKVKISVALAFSNKVKLKEYYHNSSWLENGGAPDKAARSALVSQIDAYLKQNGKYLKSDGKITFQDIEESLVLIISSSSTRTSYENQTKKAITNKFIQEAITDFLKHQLEVYFIENKATAEKIAEQMLINMRSRVRAEVTRQNLRKTLQSTNDLSNRVQKFVDCRSKDVSVRELFIVEGDSALGACKQARNSEFQAIIPVRGKILNCLKADYSRIFKNDIITDLIKVLGCGVEVHSKSNKELSSFSLDQLKWDKVIICTDADVDGFQIRALILAMIYRLMPTLINEGKIFIAESPLYEINSKDETWFAYSEKEKADIIDGLQNAKFTIQRSKGLGENEAEMMSFTTMNPETRRLIKIEADNEEATAQMFDILLGDNLNGRKELISSKGHLYIDLADVS